MAGLEKYPHLWQRNENLSENRVSSHPLVKNQILGYTYSLSNTPIYYMKLVKHVSLNHQIPHCRVQHGSSFGQKKCSIMNYIMHIYACIHVSTVCHPLFLWPVALRHGREQIDFLKVHAQSVFRDFQAKLLTTINLDQSLIPSPYD